MVKSLSGSIVKRNWLIILMCVFFIQGIAHAQNYEPTKKFNVNTFDDLSLPAQIIEPRTASDKIIVLINGSTPYDEKGHQAALWNNKGEPLLEKQDFYQRFLEVMSLKGYILATMAKRSFVYPEKRPRSSLNDLALDIVFFIKKLEDINILSENKQLILVGYSEGSTVATKVLGLLKKQPAACVLLGSASLAFNYETQSWEEWFMTEVYRKLKGFSDDELQKEFEEFSTIMTDMLTIDEDTFENEMKKTKPFGFGFAPWESFYIDREVIFYDPTANILVSNIPVLICIGENDSAMPMVLAKRTYNNLLKNGYQKATFRVIEKEVHQYKKYDVFAIIDTWLDSGGKTTEFVLDEEDKQYIAKNALINEISSSISSLPWEGGETDKTLDCFRKAKEAHFEEPQSWFKLGMVLFANGDYNESIYSFSQAIDPSFPIHYASMVWIGHINDLLNNRKEAVSWYKKGLEHYIGVPVQHDQWGMKLDEAWIKERLKTPFTGIPKNEK
jgi:pimeloyl-ACP methyl ester carboxylesterase